MIPLVDIGLGPEEKDAINKVLTSRWLTMGEVTKRFEDEFARYMGVKHAIAVANGTAALHLSCLSLGLGTGDEIIQPAINFVAAANMSIAVGATPVFADINRLDEPTISPIDIEKRITPSTKCVLVMHYGGYPCRMAEIQDICKRHKIALIEDACHAVGARYVDKQQRSPHDKMAGNLGDIACFSFFSNKNLTTGEGGMVVTNRDDLAEKIRLLRSHGMTTLTLDRHKGHASSYDVVTNGYNYRFDEIRAAIGSIQLTKLENNNRRRKKLVSVYHRNLTELPGWTIPFTDYSGESAYHLMVAVTSENKIRDQIVRSLKAAGIQTSLHYPYIPDFKIFKHLSTPELSHSRLFADRVITLPLFPNLEESQVEEICSHIISCCANYVD